MNESDRKCEQWWDGLMPQQRANVFRLIPLRSVEQVEVFSRRSWHELHSSMRDDLRKLHGMPKLADSFDLLSYFQAQRRLGRGECLHGVLYFVISDADRQSFPELRQSYGIALEGFQTKNGEGQHWLFMSEAEYDQEVLLVLSCVSLSTAHRCPHQ